MMRDSSSQLVLATVVLIMLSFSIFTYPYIPASLAYDYSPFDNHEDNHSGDSNSDDEDSSRDHGHSGDSNSGNDNNWRDHGHSDDTNSGDGKASDSLGQADDLNGANSDDTQSGESSSQEGSASDNPNHQVAFNNLAASSDSGSEASDPITPVEKSGRVDTPESDGSLGTDNSTSQANANIAFDPGVPIGDGSVSIYSIFASNYSSTQNTQNSVDEVLVAASGSMDALPSNVTSSVKGGNKAGQSNSDLSNQSASSGTFLEPTIANQTSTEGNSLGNQSSTSASSSSKVKDSSLGSPNASGSKDATIAVVTYGNVDDTNDASTTVSLDKSSYTPQDSPKINIFDHGANRDPNGIDTVRVNVTSTTDEKGITITLVETGSNTGIFEGRFSFTTGSSSTASIQIASGDNIKISYLGAAGLIFDSTALITITSPPINNPPPIAISESTNTPAVIATILTSPTTGASSLKASNSTSPMTSKISTSSEIPSVTPRSGNKTITVPGEGNVTLSYTSLLSQGELTALPVTTTPELAVMNITQGANHKPGKLTALDNTLYIPVSTVFIIAPTDARFNGTITVVIPYNATLASQPTGQDVRLLHFTGSTWEDITTLPPATGHLVTGSLSTTLGPVVAAVKSE
ncbi:MAG: hypothetical protein ABJB85_05795 [Nitrososphaerota archaeon]